MTNTIQTLKCGSCLTLFEAVHYWNYDEGRGVCRECCKRILTRKVYGRPDPARRLIKRTMAHQWPEEVNHDRPLSDGQVKSTETGAVNWPTTENKSEINVKP